MATVGKKFVDPDLWETPWFTRLNYKEKLLYLWILSRCDHTGVIDFLPSLWSAYLGFDVKEEDLKELVKKANTDQQRIEVIDHKVWLTQYIRFQQQPDRDKPLGLDNFGLCIIKRLKENNIYEEVKQRDPKLLQAYEKEYGLSETSRPIKGPSKAHAGGSSKSISNGRSEGRSNGSDHLFSKTKKIWPKLEFPEHVIIADLQRVEEYLDSENIKNPKAYIIDRLDAIAESNEKISFEKFIDGFTNESIDDVPF